jgi:N-acetyl-anhydromuramoyl-L-alanine amidase
VADGGASWRLDPVCGWLEGVPVARLRVSAHVLIRRDGGLTQYVPLHQRAWHEGASRFEDRTGCNDFSIGIELEGWDRDPYEDVQYQVLAELIGTLSAHWRGIRPERVIGHSDIVPGRKTDPGPTFEWRRREHCCPST